MKTTVRTPTLRICVEPNRLGHMNLNIQTREGQLLVGAVLTQEEAGALIFGMEQAAEALELAEQRLAA